MMFKQSALLKGIVFILVLLVSRAYAQPNLPDISGATIKGVNILKWTNQYEGVKSIEILRSADSINNFSVIATLKKPEKGVETFTDQKPMPGNNWYELNIEFNSSLKWMSKVLDLYIDSTNLALIGDSLKNKPGQVKSQKDKPGKAELKTKTLVAAIPDTSKKANAINDTLAKKKPLTNHFHLHPDTTVSDAATYFKSKYITTDLETGHVYIELPDVKKYHYMIKFYDQQNKLIVDVPKLNASPVLLDKRNFQKKGMYHFIIRKDNKDFDQGYVIIN